MKTDYKAIFIIDDDKIYQSLTKKMLLKLDTEANIIQFNDGEEAYVYFKERMQNGGIKPCVILLDINMPTMDGWEFLDELKNLNVDFSKMAIHIVSSSIALQDVERAKANPDIQGYIAKPIRPEILKNLID